MVHPEYGAMYCSAADSDGAGRHHDGVVHGAVLFQLPRTTEAMDEFF